MERAWPFEHRPEGSVGRSRARTPQAFVAAAGDGAEAVVVRIGLHDAQLVLIDGGGRWDRWVYGSMDEGVKAAEALGVPVHVGEYPEELRVRMNAHRRSADDFARAPYPEQGAVGPVIPYPENRPRRIEADDGAREDR